MVPKDIKVKEWKNKIKWSRKKALLAVGAAAILVIAFLMIPKESDGYDYLELSKGPYEEKVLAVGQMGLQGETTVVAQVSGKIQSLGGKDGETLPEGSLLVAISDPNREFLLSQKESGYLDAREQYAAVTEYEYPVALQELERLAMNMERARKDAEDARTLLAEGAISQNAYSDYLNAYKTAEAQYNSEKLRTATLAPGGSRRDSLKYRMENAKSLYDSAAYQEADYSIRAVMDTILLKSYIKPGDVVNPGDILLDIAGSERYVVTAELDEKYLLFLKEGLKAVIRVEGTDRKLTGQLESISPKVNKNTGTFPITIHILETPDFNASDLTVNIEITLEEEDSALVIPKQYVTDHGSVFLYDSGSISEVMIEFRSGPGSNVVVEKGLAEGDQILLPDPSLKDGMQVRLGKGADAD